MITALYRSLLEAWNTADAEGFAKLFAADGLLIGFDGSQVDGADVAQIFADRPVATYVAKVKRVRGDSMLYAIAGMVPPGAYDLDPAMNAAQTLVAENGKIVLFQSTPAKYMGRPDLAASHNAELTPQLLTGETLAAG